MFNIFDFEKKILLAKSECMNYSIYAVNVSGFWRFYFYDKLDNSACGFIGENYKTKVALLNDAFNYITERSGYGKVFYNHFTDIVKELKPVYISKEEIDALNRIVVFLSNDRNNLINNDVLYLKNILNKC